MHPKPQFPDGVSDERQTGGSLFGVEYKNSGAVDMNENKDAGCAVCEHNTASSVYVQWGRKICTNDHVTQYYGFIMSASQDERAQKSEFICVSYSRSGHATSDPTFNKGGNLFTTEWDVKDVGEYKKGNELSCAICAPKTKNTAVYSRWGSQKCPSGATELYKSFMATSVGGLSMLCMHPTPQYVEGIGSGLNTGARLSVVEYMDTGAVDKNQFHDAGCVVCQREETASVYTQWGRKSCTNGHHLEYYGVIMASSYQTLKNEFMCVDWERAAHAASNNEQDASIATLSTTEMEEFASGDQYGKDRELSCAVCSSAIPVYTRWGSMTCPDKTTKLYDGFMANARYHHTGSGYNYLCMHPQPEWPEGVDKGNHNGALLFGVEYQQTGAVDKNINKDAACVVCQNDSDRMPYVQWGRKACSNDHHLEYYGVIMSGLSSVTGNGLTEWVCVDWQRAAHATSNNEYEKASHLYTVELRTKLSSADEEQYGNNREISCAVCS